MSAKPVLLSLIELGGYPDFTPQYEQAGFLVVKVSSMRKGLSLLKRTSPSIVVAEFIYGPTYGSRISNLESLFAGLQSTRSETKLIVFFDKENTHHLDTLRPRFPIFEALPYPINLNHLTQTLKRAASACYTSRALK